MLRHFCRTGFLNFLNKAIFLKISTKKVKNHDFLPKNHYFGILVKVFKTIA